LKIDMSNHCFEADIQNDTLTMTARRSDDTSNRNDPGRQVALNRDMASVACSP